MNTYLKLLFLFLCSSPLTFYLSKIFVKTVEALGKESGFKKTTGFMLTGLLTAGICLTPFFFGVILATENYPSQQAPLIVLFLLFPISLIPCVLYVRKNIEIFYRTGYWKRLK